MSKKSFKSQASSSRAVSGAFGALQEEASLDTGISGFGGVSQSPLSHVYEPPDLSRISDPNLVVAFKNIQKKDSTTKSKALEDIQSYVLNPKDGEHSPEEAILEAWIKVYPRTSIDNARRVRQLAHTVQGQIAASYGKRIARRMPQIVSPWLVGIYDNDKSVSRAAQESFRLVFPSEEKFLGVWKLYQSDVVTYVLNVVENESPNTLSDERTTSPDDAMSKYTRTIGAVIIMLNKLINILPDSDSGKSSSEVSTLLNSTNLWKLASFPDAFVRRSVYKLLVTVLDRRKSDLEASLLSSNLLTTGLHSDQTGSAYDYVNAIANLSIELPLVWTQDYHGIGKKSARNRLSYFLRKGSRGGSPDFWRSIETLMKHVPIELLTEEASREPSEDSMSSYDILNALHDGIVNRDETRANSDAAWMAYLSTSQRISASISDNERPIFLKACIVPIVIQYARPSSSSGSWSISSSQPQHIAVDACLLISSRNEQLLIEELRSLSSQFIEDLRTSHPEQSKDYVKSQDSLANEAIRWYTLQSLLIQKLDVTTKHDMVSHCLRLCLRAELEAAISVLHNRNGKPYGAASALDSALQLLTKVIATNDALKNLVQTFGNEEIPFLLLSPSAKPLAHLLDLLHQFCDVDSGFTSALDAIAAAPESTQKAAALTSLLASPSMLSNQRLHSMALHVLHQALTEDRADDWGLVTKAVSNPQAPEALTDEMLSTLTKELSITTQQHIILHGFEHLERYCAGTLKAYAASPKGSKLVSRLLHIADSADSPTREQAQTLGLALQSAVSVTNGEASAFNPSVNLIKRSFEEVTPDSLSITSLTDQAKRIFKQATVDEKPAVVASLLPNQSQWADALGPFLQITPNPALMGTAALGLAIAMIRTDIAVGKNILRDADGQSLAVRIVYYTIDVIQVSGFFTLANEAQRATTAIHLALFRELADDNLTISDSLPLWQSSTEVEEMQPVNAISQIQSLLASWSEHSSMSSSISDVQEKLFEGSTGHSSASYYYSRAFSYLARIAFDKQGQILDIHRAQLKVAVKSPNTFTSAAAISSAPVLSDTAQLLNELLARLTDIDCQKHHEKALDLLILLNSLQDNQEHERDIMSDIPKPRLIFFVKHIISQLSEAPIYVQTGILKALQDALPPLSEIYGSFWEDMFNFLPQALRSPASDANLPLLAAALRLVGLFHKDWMQEANDDLLDSWADNQKPLSKCLLALVSDLKDLPDRSHQPRHVVDRMLGRELVHFAKYMSDNTEPLYSVLASESEALQISAHKFLHDTIPLNQEQRSLEKALDKTFEAKLPDELLSLILAQPEPDDLDEGDLKRALPSSWSTYLLSWNLVFDHWTNASYALQQDYGENIQEGHYLQDLLSIAVDVLIVFRHKPLDASKHRFEGYDPDKMFFDREADLHWLLIQLYYLALSHLPSPTKAWWRDNTSRQTNIAVQSWTEKYISPQIISSELSAVKEWASKQDASSDTPLTVKVSHPTREITASVPIDDRTSSISIRLPPSYPLARAEVSGLQRVGVAENKWQSWIRNAQGQLTISDGGSNALIDCLLAWRRNVTAAMKGQTECSICYSVIGMDKTLPKKECPTCKNRFHAGCLFRWFKSSNSSSCPLCRNTFAY